MVLTVIVVVYTHNLAIGVFAGVLLSMVFFAAKISRVKLTEEEGSDKTTKVYRVQAQLFFASVSEFTKSFDYDKDAEAGIKHIDIDLSESHVWDDSAVEALDKVKSKYKQKDITTGFIGVNKESSRLIEKLDGMISGH